MGSIGVERGFVAGVGLQKPPNGAIAFDGLELIGTTLEEVPNRWKLAIEVKKVKFVEAIKGLEKRLGMRRHEVAQPGLDRCFSGSIEQYPGLVIIGYCNAQLYRGPCLLKPVNPMMLTKNIRQNSQLGLMLDL